ncbi:DsbA family oxidoreductase [Actinomycetaceae bacterium WB03_NA08]|uniref:DsbA family oxidoreductase n=1 Tax=Scrofimicrobium canadense TaxID=2652290 RepID=A0A6N7VTD7_9ACTO|nr:DsbA family oxidoreductase [Scrofimicrobium canadense]MSS85029.1 DsbA family oxidoreductase [Scrofimicrobium canadense]
MTNPLTIDIWSDVQCPWCYIGKRRFETALDAFYSSHPQVDVRIVFHSFELSPDTPPNFVGSPLDYLVSRKGLSEQQVLDMFDNVTALALQEGLEYHLAEAKQVNTRKAHELLHYALKEGKQNLVKEALLRAYFTESRNVASLEELVSIAEECGLDGHSVRQSLEAGEFSAAVTNDEQQAQALGITGVPFFVLAGKYGISGAQPVEVFSQALEQVYDEQN